MKRYRVKLERKIYKDKMCVELSANNIHEAMIKIKEFIEKSYGTNEIGYIPYTITGVCLIHSKWRVIDSFGKYNELEVSLV